MARFVGERPHWFQNPALPEGSPRVRLETSVGSIELGLYEDRAPGHVANFLRLVDEGFFEGIKFHRVIPDFMIQSGDPNTRDMDPATWGQGGPGYKLDAEHSDLRHVRGALAAAKMGADIQSSGSQFYITTGTPHHLDGQHTVFGGVISGWDTIQRIEQAPRVEGTDRPREPVSIVRATRL
jgi:cyclophilin family peptidyl-prolyl cis-trans isomerase